MQAARRPRRNDIGDSEREQSAAVSMSEYANQLPRPVLAATSFFIGIALMVLLYNFAPNFFAKFNLRKKS